MMLRKTQADPSLIRDGSQSHIRGLCQSEANQFGDMNENEQVSH